VGGQAVADDLEQELRAGANNLERRRPREEQVRRRVHPPQRAVEADAVERGAVWAGREVERLAPGEHDLDRLAGGDRVLGVLDRADVLLAAEAGLDLGERRGARRAVPGACEPAGDLRGRRPGGPLQRLEDRPLGDPVPGVEVRRLAVE
jgi:hypothetical protein